MQFKPESSREIAYTGIASFIPIIGQIIIVTRPKLSVGSKIRGSVYALIASFVLLMLVPVEENDAGTQFSQDVETLPSSVEQEPPVTLERQDPPDFIAMDSCGEVGVDAERAYPVYLNDADLGWARSKLCRDAFKSIRSGTDQATVVVASFDSLDKAENFATKVGGEVGQATILNQQEAVKKIEPSQPKLDKEEIAAPKSDKELFVDTLVSNTPGLGAQEQLAIIAPGLYEKNAELWTAVDGIPISTAEGLVSEMLTGVAYKNGFDHWDKKLIDNMSTGIVKGLYRWNSGG